MIRNTSLAEGFDARPGNHVLTAGMMRKVGRTT
jgi:hypothetical protein